MTAQQWTIQSMQACLPPDCPFPFTRVEAARFVRKDVVLAQVRLFDGRVGILQILQHSCQRNDTGWCLRWQDLLGGPICWNGTCWEHISKKEETIFSEEGA